MENKGKDKDKWDKWQIVLQPVGGLLTALAIAFLGFATSSSLERQQDTDAKFRLYSELMSRREEAESSLRKEMFKSIIESFLAEKPAPSTELDLEDKVLTLELLAHNFHESLNLKPLFRHVERRILDSSSKRKQRYMERLYKVAREIARRQLLILEGSGAYFERTIPGKDLKRLLGKPQGTEQEPIELDPGNLTVGNIEREFTILVTEANATTKELRVILEIKRLNEPQRRAEFGVGFFDLPLIDNTRLSNDQRCAVVLNTFEISRKDPRVDIGLVYFPGSRASLKEKPYYEEILERLMPGGVRAK